MKTTLIVYSLIASLLRKVAITILFLAFLPTSLAAASDAYTLAISIAEYEEALENNTPIKFKKTKIPEELKEKLKPFTFNNNVGEFKSGESSSNEREVLSPQIIGGTDVQDGDFLEYALTIFAYDNFFFPWCGASLIDRKKVLTAAHCVDDLSDELEEDGLFEDAEFKVIAGISSNIFSPSHPLGFSPSSIYAVTDVNLHPDFVPYLPNDGPQNYNDALPYDIAVLTLERSATSKKAILYGGTSKLTGAVGTLVGMGDTEVSNTRIYREVDLPILPNSVCEPDSIILSTSILCAGFLGTQNKSACKGDSGGPLFITSKNQLIQVGVTAAIFNSDCLNNPFTFFTRVNEFQDFIKQHAPGATFSDDTIVISTSPSRIIQIIQLLLLQ